MMNANIDMKRGKLPNSSFSTRRKYYSNHLRWDDHLLLCFLRSYLVGCGVSAVNRILTKDK